MHYILNKIQEGEHEQLDFKFEISDSKKIARTIAAFSNTRGGKLLVGVKDNGRIAGARSDEEYYMVEAAAHLYCKPAVQFEMRDWNVDGKTVLEIDIPESHEKPIMAPDKNGKPAVYVRVHDQNIVANGVMIKVWKNKKQKEGVMLRFTNKEKILLNFLQNNEKISFGLFRRIARISSRQAETILAKLVSFGVLELHLSDKGHFYTLGSLENKEAPEKFRN